MRRKASPFVLALVAAALLSQTPIFAKGGRGVGGTVTAIDVAKQELTVEYRDAKTGKPVSERLVWTSTTKFYRAPHGRLEDASIDALKLGTRVTCALNTPDASGRSTLAYVYWESP